VTKDEFIDGYCKRSGVTKKWLLSNRNVVPCGSELGCDYEQCEGWAVVPLEFETHNGLPLGAGRADVLDKGELK
jgi:hypothetical protein